jgi:hypothetical protein
MVISNVGVMSCGKVMGAVYGLLGLVIGVIFALISMLGAGAVMAATDDAPGFLGALFGVGAIIFLPLVYGICGFLGGIITAIIYNLVAGAVGGLELDVR